MTADLAGVIDRQGRDGVDDEATQTDGDFGIVGGGALREFALALVGRRDAGAARDRLRSELGPDAIAAAAGVAAAFEAVNRVADATGTKLDDMMARALDGPLAGLGIEGMGEKPEI